ncbi:MAG TPA: PilT/PilU family type 4a pilus ATPase [Polyangiaceae bacterium]|nr:PilT/PilU family type 4a pilus ATPase [Polyangiaceae bacterium]
MPQSLYENEAFLQQLLAKAISSGASDIHIKVGQPPGARVKGDMVYFRVDQITPADAEAVARHLLKATTARDDLDAVREVDTAYSIAGLGRFRVNVYKQRSSFAAVLRAIPERIPTMEELGVAVACRQLVDKERGLVLVVGAAGNGKSSTLASMIGHINRNSAMHIVTIEDPIEFLHQDAKSSVSQREVGIDTPTFASALRGALRQDPDVILLGEIRDEETMEIALMAAETGHLVLSTLHTPDVYRTVSRMLSLSTGDPKEVRERIADTLQGIVAQRLVPRADGQGMILASEVLIVTGTVREALKRPENNPPLKDLIEKGTHPYGMQTFEMHLKHLLAQGIIDRDAARAATGF